MKWFEGSINEAVATSKSRKAVFVVFVEGKDDTSTQVAQAIDTSEVSSRLEQEEFVAIRLESGSEAYRFFAQIYQLVPVPSLFFIGENGAPLEIVAGNTAATELVTKIDLVLTKAGKNKNSSSDLINAEQKAAVASSAAKGSDTNANVEEENESTVKSNVEPIVAQSTSKEESQKKPIDVETVKPSTSMEPNEIPKVANETLESVTKELTAEEKIVRAKQLIEIQRMERIKEEERKERERELERRKIGRDVQKLRQKQQDLEIRQAHEERLREKAADAAAREKVRQQIAQDKLERKQRELNLQQQLQQKQENELPKLPTKPVTVDTNVTRIQFRLPSGNPHMGQFNPTNCLRDLRTYVENNITVPFEPYRMSISFPRRDLTHEDDNKTLLELELVPTAVILILPKKKPNVTTVVTPTHDVGFLSRFIWLLFAPIVSVYSYIMGYFSGGARRDAQRQTNSHENRDSANNSDGAVIPNLQNAASSSGLFRRYSGNQGGTTIKTEGNIHRLHSGGDDNDENNTWNGNSTQQK